MRSRIIIIASLLSSYAWSQDLQNLQSLLDNVPASGGDVQLEARTYRLEGSLHVRRPVNLKGRGSSAGNGGTVFLFAPGHGLVVDSLFSPGVCCGQRGDGAIIEQIQVRSDGAMPGIHGIIIQAPIVTLRHVSVYFFGGNCIHIYANAPVTNANHWRLENTWSVQCGGAGVYVAGSDANAGVALGASSINNGGPGFWDASFLGNTWIALHSDANAGPPYKSTSVTGQSTWIGCYSEMGQPPAELNARAFVVSGIHGAGINGTGFKALYTSDAEIPTFSQHAVLSAGLRTGNNPMALLRLGSDSESGAGGAYFSITHQSDPGRLAPPLYFGNMGPSVHQWANQDAQAWAGWSWNPGIPAPTRIALPGADGVHALIPSSTYRPPRVVEAGTTWVKELLVGGWGLADSPGPIRMTAGREGAWATGNSGTWQPGDIIFNIESSGPLFWRVVDPGQDTLPYVEGLLAETDGSPFVWLHDPITGSLSHSTIFKVGDVIRIGSTRRTISIIDFSGVQGKILTFEGGFPPGNGQQIFFTTPNVVAFP